MQVSKQKTIENEMNLIKKKKVWIYLYNLND